MSILSERLLIFFLSMMCLLCILYELGPDRLSTRRDWLAIVIIEAILQYTITKKHEIKKDKSN